MASTDTISTAICKTLRASGLSAKKEHLIENHLLIQLRSSGPEYVIERMKGLREWRLRSMTQDSYTAPPWFRHSKSRRPKPTGWESNLWFKDDKTFFALNGAIIQSICLSDPSDKQLNNWLSGLRTEPPVKKTKPPFRPSDDKLDELNRRLERKWRNRPFFNPGSIHGTRIPFGDHEMTIKRDRTDTRLYDVTSLFEAYIKSISWSSSFSWQYLQDILYEDPNVVTEADRQQWQSFLQNQKERQAEFAWGDFLDPDIIIGRQDFCENRAGYANPVGRISFLQKPGGKLRTVANPNRFNQWCIEPLGEVLSEYCNSLPGVFVDDQRAGIQHVSNMLARGEKLYSFDLSSATDTLDYETFINSFFQMEEREDTLLTRSLLLFSDLTRSEWVISDEISDRIGNPSNRVNWTVGQPLGLRPSFPILTLQNFAAAYGAQRLAQRRGEVDNSKDGILFAIVGDDLVCSSRIADDYHSIITGMNGKINLSKTLVSDQYAEFCSQLITKNSSYPLKPRFIEGLDGAVDNLFRLKSKELPLRVPKWVRTLSKSVGAYALDEYPVIPQTKADRKSLDQRLLVNAYLSVAHDKRIPLPHIVSYETMYKAMESTLSEPSIRSQINSGIAEAVWNHLPNRDDILTDRMLFDDYVDRTMSMLTQVPVSVPPITYFNWRSQAYEPPTLGKITSLRKLQKKIDRLEYDPDKERLSGPLEGLPIDSISEIILTISDGQISAIAGCLDKPIVWDASPAVEELLTRRDEVLSMMEKRVERHVSTRPKMVSTTRRTHRVARNDDDIER